MGTDPDVVRWEEFEPPDDFELDDDAGDGFECATEADRLWWIEQTRDSPPPESAPGPSMSGGPHSLGGHMARGPD